MEKYEIINRLQWIMDLLDEGDYEQARLASLQLKEDIKNYGIK